MNTTKQAFSAILASCLMWYGLLAVTACTEQAEYTVAQSDIPIYFSVSMNTLTEHPVSRTTATSFEPQDQIGLFATLPPTTLNDQRYIDNLLLTTTDGKNFSPAQIVYYPEGDASLNFTAYHPYQANGLPAESSILPVSIQADQSTSENFSKSDFLWTQKNGVNSSSEAVQLNFTHKFSKLKIALVPEAEEDLTALAEDQPRIVVTGIKTEANCNLTDGTLSDLQTPSDIIPYGTWTVEENKLVGKELIFIPQALHSQEQSIIIEWRGRIYVYLMPDVELQEAEQCEITIEFQKEENEQLTGIAGSITDWTDAEIGGNSNEQNNSVIYTSSLSFASSNIYQIYYQGRAIAEICKEYLISESLTSRAIVHYPIVSQTGKADLKNGTILCLLDVEDACMKGLGQKLIDIILAYQAVIQAAGLDFGVYTGLSFYNSFIKPYAGQIDCHFWIARYPSSSRKDVDDAPSADKQPLVSHILEGWQWASTGRVDGISGNVDFNEWYGAIPEPQVSGNPYPIPERLLKLTHPNMRGDDVKWAQKHLVRLGFLPDETEIDGVYGPKTKVAVRAAQKHYGIAVDGIVGANTIYVIRWN